MPQNTLEQPIPLEQANPLESTLEATIRKTLLKQHSWTAVKSHTCSNNSLPIFSSSSPSSSPSSPSSTPGFESTSTSVSTPLPLPLLSGLPPTRLYISPRDQEEFLRVQAVLSREERGERSEPSQHQRDEQGDQQQSEQRSDQHSGQQQSESDQPSDQASMQQQQQQQQQQQIPKATATATATATAAQRKEAFEREFFAPVREFVACAWKNSSHSTSTPTSHPISASTSMSRSGDGLAGNEDHGVSLARLAATFELVESVRRQRGEKEGTTKDAPRMLLGIVDSDSTVVFYVVHDGIVKARQN